MHFFAKIFVKNRLFSPGSVPINHTCLFYSFSRITGCFRANQARSNGGFLQKTHPEPIESWTKNLNDLKASPLRLEIQIWQKKSFEKSSHPATHILIAFLLKKSRKEYGDLTKHIFCTLLLKTYLSASWWSKNI